MKRECLFAPYCLFELANGLEIAPRRLKDAAKGLQCIVECLKDILISLSWITYTGAD